MISGLADVDSATADVVAGGGGSTTTGTAGAVAGAGAGGAGAGVGIGAVAVVGSPKVAEDMRAGTTVVGGVKNEPSSSVSRKSLIVMSEQTTRTNEWTDARQDRKLVPKRFRRVHEGLRSCQRPPRGVYCSGGGRWIDGEGRIASG